MSKRNIIYTVIAILLIIVLLRMIHPADIVSIIKNIPASILIGTFALSITCNFFRALRFYILLKQKINLGELFSIACAHNLSLNLLPARLGEAAYLYFAGRNKNITLAHAASSLVLTRLFDMITVAAAFFFVSVLFGETHFPSGIEKYYPVVLCTGVLTAFVILRLLIKNKERVLNFLRRASTAAKADNLTVTKKFFTFAEEISNGFGLIRNWSMMLLCFLISTAIWASVYFNVFILLKSFGIEIMPIKFMFAFIFMAFFSALPIHGPGSFGTIETGWSAALVFFNTPKALAITSAFALHLMMFFYAFILGLYGILRLGIKRGTD